MQQGYGRLKQGSMEEKTFDFWQDHSLHYLEMAFRTDRHERPAHPEGYGKRTGVCGDTIEIFLSFLHGRIQNVSFQTDGCMNTNACANTVGQLAEGKSIEEAWEITPQHVVDFLETLPAGDHHCAELAVGAFYLALADAERRRRDAYRWRKKNVPSNDAS